MSSKFAISEIDKTFQLGYFVKMEKQWFHRVGEILKERKISQNKLAAMIGEGPPTLSKALTGKGGHDSIIRVTKIAHALNVPVSYLLWGGYGSPSVNQDELQSPSQLQIKLTIEQAKTVNEVSDLENILKMACKLLTSKNADLALLLRQNIIEFSKSLEKDQNMQEMQAVLDRIAEDDRLDKTASRVPPKLPAQKET